MSQNRKTGYLCALGAVTIWSGFILVSRSGGLSELTAYDVIALRYATATLVLLPVWLFWQRFNLFEFRYICIGMIGGLAYALFAFNGFEHAPASHAAVLLPGTLPIAIILLTTVIHKEQHPPIKWIGIALMTVGTGILTSNELNAHGDAVSNDLSPGHVMLIGAAICWATFSVLIKQWNIGPWQAVISLAFFTCVIYLPIYLLWLPSHVLSEHDRIIELLPEIGLQAFYQGIMATIVQMLLYVRAVQLIGAASMGAMMALVPVLAGMAAIPIFSEAINHALFLALVFVSTGLVLANSTVSMRTQTKIFPTSVSISTTSKD